MLIKDHLKPNDDDNDDVFPAQSCHSQRMVLVVKVDDVVTMATGLREHELGRRCFCQRASGIPAAREVPAYFLS